jgi:hypothetical protein
MIQEFLALLYDKISGNQFQAFEAGQKMEMTLGLSTI